MSNRIKSIPEGDGLSPARVKAGHVALLDVLEKINGQARNPEAVKFFLRELEDKLLGHFVVQNEQFYNDLILFYAEQKDKAKMTEFLKIDLRGLKLKTVEFFDRYPVEGAYAHFVDFPREFSFFYHDILLRIKMEEERLFPLITV